MTKSDSLPASTIAPFDLQAAYWPLRTAADWIAQQDTDGMVTFELRDKAAKMLFEAIDDGIKVTGLWGTEIRGKWKQTNDDYQRVRLNFSRASTDPEDFQNGICHWVCWETPGDEVHGDIVFPLNRWPSYWTNLRVATKAILERWPNGPVANQHGAIARRPRVESLEEQMIRAFVREKNGGRWPRLSDRRIKLLIEGWLADETVYARWRRRNIGETTIRNFRKRHDLGPDRELR